MRQDECMDLLQSLLPVACKAGDAVMAVYGTQTVGVQHKADQSPLTAADLAAHHVLLDGLRLLRPDVPVVSEEDAASWAHRQAQGRFWLIDPLDGTREFIARNGEFTVNVALIEAGRSVLGVVYAPALGALYWGGPELGAFCQTGGQTRAIRVQAPEVGGACRVVASKSHLDAATQAWIEKLGAVNLLQAGSSLKFCRVAEGAADVYPRMAPTCEWDTAAAQAVLEGAGGVVLDLEGQPLRYGKPDVINPAFVAARAAGLARP